MTGAEALARFDTHTEVYKVFKGHDIHADILLPKGLVAGTHPVIVYWHGGALVFGSRNYAPFFQAWIHPFAEQNAAIVISPDYRLLPESSTADIIEDLEDFWTWLKRSLPSILEERSSGTHCPDLTRIILAGGSAGGFCSIHLGLSHPDEIKALALQYPFVQLMSEKTLQGTGGKAAPGIPLLPKEVIEDDLKKMTPGVVVTAGDDQRTNWGFSGIIWGFHSDWLGYDDHHNPTLRIKKGVKLPPKIWLLQGEEDSSTSAEEARTFAAKVRKFCPQTEVRTDFVEGKEHGFDTVFDAPFLDEGLAFTKEAWLK